MNLLVQALLVFVAGIVGGFLPFLVPASSQRGARLLSLGNALGGGIFISAGLLHMLPDADAAVKALAPDVDFPTAFLVATLFFVLILTIDFVLLGGHDHAHAFSTESSTDLLAPDVVPVDKAPATSVLNVIVLLLALSVHSIIAGLAAGLEEDAKDTFVMFIAIVAHKWSAVMSMTIAAIHAGLPANSRVAIVVGLSLVTPCAMIVGSLARSALSSSAAAWASALGQAAAAGTFLYVAILEIIYTEFSGAHDVSCGLAASRRGFQGWRLLALCFGITIMALIAIVD
jgi:zinc transporter 1/2/3